MDLTVTPNRSRLIELYQEYTAKRKKKVYISAISARQDKL